MEALINQLRPMRDDLAQMMSQLDIEAKAEEVKSLEEEASQANFWDDSQVAQKKMQRMSRLKRQVEKRCARTSRIRR